MSCEPTPNPSDLENAINARDFAEDCAKSARARMLEGLKQAEWWIAYSNKRGLEAHIYDKELAEKQKAVEKAIAAKGEL